MPSYKEQEMKERIMQLEFELQDKKSEVLKLKKENETLYASVKQSVEQASSLRTELEENKRFYTKKIADIADQKAELSKKIDILQIEFDRINSVYSSVGNAREIVRKESFELMDKVRETSMDSVTMIDFILKDISRLKLDLDNMVKSESTKQQDINDEIELVMDLLNTHINKLKTIRSGFYRINNITEYDNSVEDLTLSRDKSRIINGNYVD